MVVYGGNSAFKAETTNGENLPVILKAVFFLPTQSHMFKCHPVGIPACVDTNIESTDFNIFEKQRADSVSKSHVDAVNASAVAGINLHVVDGSLHGGIEANADGARVFLAGAERQIADGVALFHLLAVASENHGLREIWIFKAGCAIGQVNNGASHALTL